MFNLSNITSLDHGTSIHAMHYVSYFKNSHSRLENKINKLFVESTTGLSLTLKNSRFSPCPWVPCIWQANVLLPPSRAEVFPDTGPRLARGDIVIVRAACVTPPDREIDILLECFFFGLNLHMFWFRWSMNSTSRPVLPTCVAGVVYYPGSVFCSARSDTTLIRPLKLPAFCCRVTIMIGPTTDTAC